VYQLTLLSKQGLFATQGDSYRDVFSPHTKSDAMSTTKNIAKFGRKKGNRIDVKLREH
jgi:hypothetical protein